MLTLGMRSGPSGAISPPVVLLQDGFVDVNGTNLSSHVMNVGPGWLQDSGTWVIESDTAVVSAGASENIAHSQSGQSNVTVTAVVTPGANSCGVVFRYTNSSNYWVCVCDNGNSIFQIAKVVAGSFTNVTNQPHTFTSTGDQTIKVSCNGPNITAVLNGGAAVLHASDAFSETGTVCGLAMFSNVQSSVLSFLVTQP